MNRSWAFLFPLFCLVGCSHTPRIYLTPQPNVSGDRTVAVLPFENLSGEEGAGEKVQKIFLVELLKLRKFSVFEPGEVAQALKELRIRATDKLSQEQASQLKEKLGVDWICLGSVLEFAGQRQGTAEVPVVSLTARILDAASGKIIWAAFESRQGDDAEFLFGVGKINSASELAKKIAEKMVVTLNRR